jgi:hypothetical protein
MCSVFFIHTIMPSGYGTQSLSDLASIDPSMLLILSARGDEASRWLRVWDVAAQGPFLV